MALPPLPEGAARRPARSISTICCCCTEELFAAASPTSAAQEAGRFDHLLVDEYQDTNGSQYRIVKALAGGHRNLCVVGDDDQSIYGWRGAEVTHILRFQRDWPEAKVVRLEENYRSTAPILELANRLIAFNQHAARQGAAGRARRRRAAADPAVSRTRPTKPSSVVADIRRQLAEPRRCSRATSPSCSAPTSSRGPFETELRRAKLPYVLVGGMSFFDRKEVRDILAYLKLLANPARRSLAAADHQHAAARHRAKPA